MAISGWLSDDYIMRPKIKNYSLIIIIKMRNVISSDLKW